jgi:hypothetical protein
MSMSRKEVVQATKDSELASTFRVYRLEFIFDSRHASSEAAMHRFELTYADRVKEEHWNLRENKTRTEPFELWVKKWNMVGQFKHREDAEAVAKEQEEQGFEVRTVDRNSREEHVLKNYGQVKLTGV